MIQTWPIILLLHLVLFKIILGCSLTENLEVSSEAFRQS
jgi:hypothetical protein